MLLADCLSGSGCVYGSGDEEAILPLSLHDQLPEQRNDAQK